MVSSNRSIARVATAVGLLPAAALCGLFVYWPLARLGALSLQAWDGVAAPTPVGLTNYATMLSDSGIGVELQHSLLWLGVSLAAPVCCGLATALGLAYLPSGLRNVLRVAFAAPLLLPSVAIAVMWRLVYNPLDGPLNDLLRALHLSAWAQDWLGDPRLALWAVLLPAVWAGSGLPFLAADAALRQIPADVLDAAQVDGAGGARLFVAVTLPALRGHFPLIVVTTALSAVPAYDLISLLTNGGPGYATTTLALDMFGRAFGGGQVGMGAAMGVVQAAQGFLMGSAAIWLMRHGWEIPTHTRRAGAWRIRTMPLRWSIAAAMILSAAVIVSPLAWLLLQATQTRDGTTWWMALGDTLTTIVPQGMGLAFVVSLSVGIGVATLTILASVLAATIMATWRGWAAHAVTMLLCLGVFQPTAVLVIPLFSIAHDLRLLDSSGGLVVVEAAQITPLGILLLRAGVRAIPNDLLAAAAIDGARRGQMMRVLIVPLLAPLLTLVGLWAFVSSWNAYLLPTVMIQSNALQTVPLVLAHFTGTMDTQYNLLAAATLVTITPLLLVGLSLSFTIRRVDLWRR